MEFGSRGRSPNRALVWCCRLPTSGKPIRDFAGRIFLLRVELRFLDMPGEATVLTKVQKLVWPPPEAKPTLTSCVHPDFVRLSKQRLSKQYSLKQRTR